MKDHLFLVTPTKGQKGKKTTAQKLAALKATSKKVCGYAKKNKGSI